MYYNYWLFAKYLPHAIPHSVLSLVPLPIFPCHLFVLILINGRCFSCLNIRIPIHFLQLHFITCFWWIFHGRFSFLDTCVDEKMFAVLSLYSFWWMKLCNGHVVNIRTTIISTQFVKIGDVVLKVGILILPQFRFTESWKVVKIPWIFTWLLPNVFLIYF